MTNWAVTTCAWTKSGVHCPMQLIPRLANRLTWSRALLLFKSARDHCATPAHVQPRPVEDPQCLLVFPECSAKEIARSLAKNARDRPKLLHLHTRSFRGGLKSAVDWCQTVKASLVCVMPHPESLRTDFLTTYIITWMELEKNSSFIPEYKILR